MAASLKFHLIPLFFKRSDVASNSKTERVFRGSESPSHALFQPLVTTIHACSLGPARGADGGRSIQHPTPTRHDRLCCGFAG